MPSSLMLLGTLLVLSGAAVFWTAWRYRLSRYHFLMAAGVVTLGLSWFVRSDSARAWISSAAAVFMLTAVISLMIGTWRQASIDD